MKKALVVLTLLIMGVTVVFSQERVRETVYLKNGSIIKGIVIEQIPNESLKIQTADGSIFVYRMAEVEKITKEIITSSRGSSRSAANASDFSYEERPIDDIRGYRGFADLGYTIGIGDYREGRVEFSTSHGYQFNSYFFVGGGLGLQYFSDSDICVIPVFADLRANFTRGPVVPFGGVKIGYSWAADDGNSGDLGFYMSPSIGVRFSVARNLAFNISAGYTVQLADAYYYNGYGTYYSTENFGGITLKAGIEF